MESALSSLTQVLGMSGCEPAVELSLPAVRDSLGLIRETLETFFHKQLPSSMPPEEVEEILLAVQEACTNVVRHAYESSEEPGRMVVRAEARAYLLRIAVIDEGLGYDPEAIPTPDPLAPREGGFGLHLIRTTMSKVSYFQHECQNVLLMEKSLLRPRRSL